MEFQAAKSSLDPILGVVGKIVESSRASNLGYTEITDHFLLEAKDGVLEVTATDTVTFMRMACSVDIQTPGAVAVNAPTLGRAVRVLPDDNIKFKLNDEQMTISAGRGRYVLPTLPAGDYPSFPEPEGKQDADFKISVPDLHHLLHTTAVCASDNESRYYLNGVYLHSDEGKLLAVATDGMRLARCHIKSPGGAEKMKGVIIPRRAVGQIESLLADRLKLDRDADKEEEAEEVREHDPVSVSTGETMAWFALGKTRIATKLVDGAFPDYDRVIPRDNNRLLSVAVAPLKEALARALVVSTDNVSAVRFDLENDSVKVSSGESNMGNFEDTLDAAYDSETLAVGFNGSLLSELMPPLQEILGDDGRIDLHLLDEVSPMLFHASGDDPSLVYVLMPLRI